MSDHIPDGLRGAVRPVGSPAEAITPGSGPRKRKLSETDLTFSPSVIPNPKKGPDHTTPQASPPSYSQSQASLTNGALTRPVDDVSANESAYSAAIKSLEPQKTLDCRVFNEIIQLFCSARPGLCVFEPLTTISNHPAWPSRLILKHYTWFGIPICLDKDWALVTLNFTKKKGSILSLSEQENRGRSIAQDFLRSVSNADELDQWGFESPGLSHPIDQEDHGLYHLIKTINMVLIFKGSQGRKLNSFLFFRRFFTHILETGSAAAAQEPKFDDKFDETFRFAPCPTSRMTMSAYLDHVKSCIKDAYRINYQSIESSQAEIRSCTQLSLTLEYSFSETRMSKARTIYEIRRKEIETQIEKVKEILKRVRNLEWEMDSTVADLERQLVDREYLLKLNQGKTMWLERMEKLLPSMMEFVDTNKDREVRNLKKLEKVAEDAEGSLGAMPSELRATRMSISDGLWSWEKR